MDGIERVKDCIDECLGKASELIRDSVIIEFSKNDSFTFDMFVRELEIALAVEKQKGANMKD